MKVKPTTYGTVRLSKTRRQTTDSWVKKIIIGLDSYFVTISSSVVLQKCCHIAC
jgi:hypothetical protein